ncbi:MAG TPA: hypothetical protein VNO30_01570 [Kofleriaceae bacterium]|nr:hypothetical protein [Kofleriaceae bacterium]
MKGRNANVVQAAREYTPTTVTRLPSCALHWAIVVHVGMLSSDIFCCTPFAHAAEAASARIEGGMRIV